MIPAKLLGVAIVGLLGYVLASYFVFPTRFRNQIEIEGPSDLAFDLVTTAKYWPTWHPATLGVTGAIDHPMQVGDTIYERVNIFGVTGQVKWTVVERTPPHSLRIEGRSTFGWANISYTFERTGDKVGVTRDPEYAFLGLGGPLDWLWIKPLMERQSAIAVDNLKRLVEQSIGQGQN
jgi:hypothetical protein